ncbi:hypothetical protein CHS0354_018477 [Potamilus streckersoni]|uniref:Di-haem cytochrome c peroxidase domain-containing protein n=1 Tax=Potamilus streckersoni TaxID=2493646 RepID=A0AAE0W9C0_9BIVA|nr:hypothetical protein CHS0354_018477 [Potamilus streckersoni]
MMKNNIILSFVILSVLAVACGKADGSGSSTDSGDPASTTCAATEQTVTTAVTGTAVQAKFGTKINLTSPADYAGQSVPSYITKCNGAGISNAKATLGRVLFYDKALSIDDTVSCASCHQQAFAFSDPDISSDGVSGGKTGRHSMRLVNARFAEEVKFFWDERAASLEAQTTQPIQDHNEMGFSGQSGRGIIYVCLRGHCHYRSAAAGSPIHFVRSIQSFDSKYDTGITAVNGNHNAQFTNFSTDENAGKALFTARATFDAAGNRTGGGAGCAGCHRPPEFDIDNNSRNNGIIASFSGSTDTTVTRSPTLRDTVNASGTLNGPLMHTGGFTSLADVVRHYNGGINNVTNLDNRLRPNGQPQRLQLTDA